VFLSSSNKEPITIIEFDIDYCNLTFGTAPCTASLSGSTTKKCFNSFYTCKDQENYDKGSLTYKFAPPRSGYPKGETVFPCLVSVSGSSAQANIAAADDRLSSLGKRGKISAEFFDFPYHDRFMDKYQSERVSGDAQSSGVGYQPIDQGTFWTKFKARNPNYAGRPMRKKTGYIQDGVLTIEKTRHYVITDIRGPDSDGRVTVEGKDILKLADDDRAVAPAQSRGKLKSEITDANGQSFDLNPTGIGSEYSASGRASIGSELVSFTRSGDTVTLTGRGLSGTEATDHSIDDTFQEAFSVDLARVDDTIYDLLVNYAGIDASFIDADEWETEVTRWAPSLLLTTDIMKPEGVAKLIGEIAVLGVTIWWDDVNQKIRLRINRPVDLDVVTEFSDTKNHIEAHQEDRADDRITEVIFNSVQIDPSRGVSDENFARGDVIISSVEKLPEAFGDTRIKKINCRWLNHGDDANVRVVSLRLLDRFRLAPVRYTIKVDYKDDLSIADVVDLKSHIVTSDTGELQSQLSQVIIREDVEEGHTVNLTLQKFQFDKRYGFITENDMTTYTLSTAAQKRRGAYFVDEDTLEFGDGDGPYLMI
jgi:hypothetical protein